MSKPVRFRDRATLDVQQSRLAASFIDELETQISTISRMSQSGSSRFAVELGIPELHFQVMLRHHHLIFYVEAHSHIDVIRVLDSRRDLGGLF